jgi:predicted AlkP superfamily pyrophosphatase or phosphodiesterase
MVCLLSAFISAQEVQPSSGQQPAIPRNIILFSWDGLDRSVVQELLDQHQLPNLVGLIKEGSFQPIEVIGHVTVTKPGHAEMLTGLSAEQTKVYSNANYQPIPVGDTVFEKLQQQFGGKDKIRTIMVTGKLAHVGGRGPEETQAFLKQQQKKKNKSGNQKVPPEADDTILNQNQGEPFYLTRKSLDIFDAAQRDAEEVGSLSLKYLAKYREPRFFAFLHFSDPDHAGHRFGIDSQEYRDAAVKDDVWLGKIIEWLKQENLYTTTLIYVMTDHGFDVHGKSHNNAPHSWLATNDKKVTRGGIIADVPATIMVRFGINIAKLEPKLIGAELTGPPRIIKPTDYFQQDKKSAKPLKPLARFNRLDINRDGILTKDEVARPKVFKQMDVNHDGKVTQEEAVSYFKQKKAN